MPKIIENVRGQLLEETKRQLREKGYAKTTIRSVSAACGLGVGTVYNYFKSKELLTATLVLENWLGYLENMKKLNEDNPRELLFGIYDSIRCFAAENEALFSDADAAKLISGKRSERHRQLRLQIAALVVPLCEKGGVENPSFSAEFIAEAMISWSLDSTDFEQVYQQIEKILKK